MKNDTEEGRQPYHINGSRLHRRGSNSTIYNLMLDWKRTCNLYERCSVLLCCHYCEQFYRFINRLLPWSMSTFLFLMSVYELKSTDHVRQLQWTNNDLSSIVSLLIPFRINDLIHWFRLICKEQSVSLYLFTFLSSIHMLPQSFYIYILIFRFIHCEKVQCAEATSLTWCDEYNA